MSAQSNSATGTVIPAVAAPVTLPARPLTPEEQPPSPPQIMWDGEQLTIFSDNSRLSDILTAVKVATGAEIDIPSSAARERVAARLGPGPARDVISTLLGGTDFDFVVQASDSDPSGIQLVLLTPRGKSEGILASGRSLPADTPARAANRRYQQQNRFPTDQAAQDETTAVQPDVTPDTSAAAAAPTDPAAEAAPAAAQPASPDQAAPAANPSDVRPVISDIAPSASDGRSMQADLKTSPEVSGLDSSQSPANSSQDRIQQMQQMFEQRRMLQEQANKTQGSR